MSYVELFEDSDPEPETREEEVELDEPDKPRKIRSYQEELTLGLEEQELDKPQKIRRSNLHQEQEFDDPDIKPPKIRRSSTTFQLFNLI